MIDLFNQIWFMSFQCIQSAFDFDFFLGQYLGLCVVVFSTVFILTYLFLGLFSRSRRG